MLVIIDANGKKDINDCHANLYEKKFINNKNDIFSSKKNFLIFFPVKSEKMSKKKPTSVCEYGKYVITTLDFKEGFKIKPEHVYDTYGKAFKAFSRMAVCDKIGKMILSENEYHDIQLKEITEIEYLSHNNVKK